MPKQTSFLSLILPEKNEFVDSWNDPVNQNSEDIDSWIEDLYDSLVGTSSTSTWSSLRGSHGSLAARLNVSINSDGTINVSSSPDILDMSTSEVRGQFSGPRDRLNDSDHQMFDARQPVADGRFSPMASGGPSAGFPGEDLDAGMALRSADFGASSDSPLGSPMMPSAPGLVRGGASSLITGTAEHQVTFHADTTPAIFNIDGYIFRIREQIQLDYALLSPAAGNYVWIFAERNDASYGTSSYRYSQDGGFASKDLRRRQEGSDGLTSGSVFTSSSAKFTTAILGKVKEGDTLVIEGGDAAGSYVINAIDLTSTDTKLTVKGIFKADLSGLSWHVLDNAIPNIGAVVTDSDPTTEPPFVAGRVYIGRALHVVSSPPDPVVPFADCGVFDSGWQAVTAAGIAASGASYDHNLGAIPSSVEIQFRVDPQSDAYEPIVRRTFVTNVTGLTDGDAAVGSISNAVVYIPSTQWKSSNTTLVVSLKNSFTDPSVAEALFTDISGADQISGEMRVIARR